MADQYAVPLSRCSKEDLLWIIKHMCMRDRSRYELDRALSELAYEKEKQRIKEAEHYAKLAEEKRREYIEILRPYEGKPLLSIPLSVLNQADAAAKAADKADQQWARLLGIDLSGKKKEEQE